MFTHKRISKMPRKNKTNELNDNCEYVENKDNDNKNKEI